VSRLVLACGTSIKDCVSAGLSFGSKIIMAIATVRGLLERMEMLMRLNVAIVADKYVEDGDILRLVDVRRIPDAMELIRVLYTQLRGVDMSASSDQ
jgi:hypothetical protein